MAVRQRAQHSPAPGDVLAALDRIRAEVDALRLIVAGEALAPITPTEPAAPVVDDPPEWATLQQAAHEMGCSPETAANRARLHGLGRRPDGGPWQIDLARCRRWRAGQPYERLPSFDAGRIRKNRERSGCSSLPTC